MYKYSRPRPGTNTSQKPRNLDGLRGFCVLGPRVGARQGQIQAPGSHGQTCPVLPHGRSAPTTMPGHLPRHLPCRYCGTPDLAAIVSPEAMRHAMRHDMRHDMRHFGCAPFARKGYAHAPICRCDPFACCLASLGADLWAQISGRRPLGADLAAAVLERHSFQSRRCGLRDQGGRPRLDRFRARLRPGGSVRQ